MKDSKDENDENNQNNENDGNDGNVRGSVNRLHYLEDENIRLKSQVKALACRVTELEKELLSRDNIPSPSPFNTILNIKTTDINKDNINNLNNEIDPLLSRSVPMNSKHLSRITTTNNNNDVLEIIRTESISAPVTVMKEKELSGLSGLILPTQCTAEGQSSVQGGVQVNMTSFKPIILSSSNTMNTLMGTRVSNISSTATTLATETTNAGSVSPLTEVTDGFIRRAQRASQSINTLSNINMSSNVSICTSEQEHMNSETASEDSGVLVSTSRIDGPSSMRIKENNIITIPVEMEMSSLNSLNLITSFNNVVSEQQTQSTTQTAIQSQSSIQNQISPSTATSTATSTSILPNNIPNNNSSEVIPTIPTTIPTIQAAQNQSVQNNKKVIELAALDGDEEDDDGWS